MKNLPRNLRKLFEDRQLKVNSRFKKNLMQQLLQKEEVMATKKSTHSALHNQKPIGKML